MPLSRQQVYLGDFHAEAQKLRKGYGRTSLFSTGNRNLDVYMGGGFGREDNYEIVLLYGPTGIGKSTVALNFVADAIVKGTKVGLLVLEDDMADVSNRLSFIMTSEQYAKANRDNVVLCLPQDALIKAWKLDDLLEYIERWYVEHDVDLILLDHLQFAFESAEAIKGENEWTSQRIFMQKLNFLMKRVKKTIILVSHQNKANGSKGMDKIVGSGAIAQAATKVIEIAEDSVADGIRIHMRKSRFTKRPESWWAMKLVNSKLEGQV